MRRAVTAPLRRRQPEGPRDRDASGAEEKVGTEAVAAKGLGLNGEGRGQWRRRNDDGAVAARNLLGHGEGLLVGRTARRTAAVAAARYAAPRRRLAPGLRHATRVRAVIGKLQRIEITSKNGSGRKLYCFFYVRLCACARAWV